MWGHRLRRRPNIKPELFCVFCAAHPDRRQQHLRFCDLSQTKYDLMAGAAGVQEVLQCGSYILYFFK